MVRDCRQIPLQILNELIYITPENHQKTIGFLRTSGGREIDLLNFRSEIKDSQGVDRIFLYLKIYLEVFQKRLFRGKCFFETRRKSSLTVVPYENNLEGISGETFFA